MRSRVSGEIVGRPPPPRRDFLVQYRRKPLRCQRTKDGDRFEDGECLETARPEAVEPDPKEALAATETEPFAVSPSNHCQLLTQSEDLQV